MTEIISIGTKGRQLGNQHSEMIVNFDRREGVNEAQREFDLLWLREKAEGGRWSLRKTLVDSTYADMVRKLASQKGKKGKKTDSAAATTSRKITDFFKDSSKMEIAPTGLPSIKEKVPTRISNLVTSRSK